ncbi:Hypothetical protein CINCED_3A021579 [Cinara cedri]|uniref:Uncharacterized protein n=1 Tax=Cinara cedri TaxID=506608 RepID=A0A5E4NDR7_9HEMI|nr:Hypothetical protein CINCED_3A021579 [Cinara cedri]
MEPGVAAAIDVNMLKTPVERSREYRARKKLLKKQKPPAQTASQRKGKYMARQKALRNAVTTIVENETLMKFSRSRESRQSTIQLKFLLNKLRKKCSFKMICIRSMHSESDSTTTKRTKKACA